MAEEKLFIEASEEDVPSIIALRQRIWGTTYRGVYPDSMIDNFDWDWHREMELLRVHHPAYSVYLVRKDRQDNPCIFPPNTKDRGSAGKRSIS